MVVEVVEEEQSVLPLNQILQGHAAEVLKNLPDESIDLCFTSTPYFGLRTYLADGIGEIGRESSMYDYIDSLVQVFGEVKKKLKPTGSLFVNIGDTYNGDKSGTSNGSADQGSTIGAQKKDAVDANAKINKIRQPGIPQKSLLGIPQRLRLTLTDKLGFCLRNEIIWNKPNAMPGSAMDRWASSHEYILFFTKEPDGYYFDTQYEPFRTGGDGDTSKNLAGHYGPMRFGGKHKHKGYGNKLYSAKPWNPQIGVGGRIARDVWTINTQGRRDAHFATFPDELPRRAILASCPQFVCGSCGFMRKKQYKKIKIDTRPGLNNGNGKSGGPADPNAKFHNSELSTKRQRILRVPVGVVGGYQSPEYNGQATKDYDSATAQNPSDAKRSILKSMFMQKVEDGMSTCTCNTGWQPGVVLDPFCGRGTTCIIARMLGRDFIGIDLNPEFCKIARNYLEELMEQDRLTPFLR